MAAKPRKEPATQVTQNVTYPRVDLTDHVPQMWPSNPVFRKNTTYIDIEDLTLESAQTGKMVKTPVGFVLERIDLAVITPPEVELSLEFATADDSLAGFTVAADSKIATRTQVGRVAPGTYLPETWINVVNNGSARPAGYGRVAISLIGYGIEPWA